MADDSTLWVGGLADEVTEDLLYELFLQAGPLEKVTRPKEPGGKKLKPFAFVAFRHPESVPYAIQVMEGIRLFGQHLRLKARTGSRHDTPSPVRTNHQFPPGIPRSQPGPEMHRSRSFHGQEELTRGSQFPSSPLTHPKGMLQRSGSGGDNRQPGSSFNGPADLLGLPLNNMSSLPAQHMQPQSMDNRRKRVLQQQALSLQAHSVQNPYGNPNMNYTQSFGNFGRRQQQQPWYPNHPQQQFY